MSRRRTLLIAGIGAAVLLTATGGALAAGYPHHSSGSAAADAPNPPQTVTVERTTLSQTRDLSGQLGFADPRSLTGRAAGTVTWLPRPGTQLGRGSIVYRVDNLPVVLLLGDTPLYRTLGAQLSPPPTDPPADGSADDTGDDTAPPADTGDDEPAQGPDVAVLEQNLAAMGFLDTTPDDQLTDYTVEAIKEWQESLGEDPTGQVDPTRVVVRPGEARVDQLDVQLGDDAATTVLELTAAEKVVTVPIDAGDVTGLPQGQRVRLTLPSGKQVRGRVSSIGKDAVTPDGNGPADSSAPPQVVMTVRLHRQSAVRHLDSGPVTVTVPGEVHQHVLAVPVASLLALREGGYAVQVVGSGAEQQLIAVETGMFADGLVEVTGPGLKAGLKIVTTS